MKVTLVLFFTFLLFSGSFCSKIQDVQYLESIKSKEFGKTILQSLQLELRTGSKDAVNNILNLLYKLRDDNLAEQQREDTLWQEESATCSTKKTELQAVIDTNEAIIKENDGKLTVAREKLSESEGKLKNLNDGLEITQKSLEILTNNRAAEVEAFNRDIAKLAETLSALRKGKEIIKNLLESEPAPSFFQKPNTNILVQFQNSFKNFNIEGKFKGFVKALISLLNKQIIADQKLVQRVIDLIDQLIAQLTEEVSSLSIKNQQSQDAFESEQNRYNSEIEVAKSEISSVQADIARYKDEISRLESDTKERKDVNADKAKQLEDETKSCNDKETAYNEKKTNRSSELEIINKVINIFETRFENVRGYLKENSFF